MAQNALSYALPAAPRPRFIGRGSWAALVRRGRALVRLWLRRARTRRALAELDERLLRDVGLDPMTAREEARLPFWRASTMERR
jgi:uncharacterized protein YjiS (DUF1127 family)